MKLKSEIFKALLLKLLYRVEVFVFSLMLVLRTDVPLFLLVLRCWSPSHSSSPSRSWRSVRFTSSTRTWICTTKRRTLTCSVELWTLPRTSARCSTSSLIRPERSQRIRWCSVAAPWLAWSTHTTLTVSMTSLVLTTESVSSFKQYCTWNQMRKNHN